MNSRSLVGYRIPAKRRERLEEMHETHLRLLAKKRAYDAKRQRIQTAEVGYMRYAQKLREERAVNEKAGSCPYDRAVRGIEKVTGVPAAKWEHKLNHPYVALANRVARDLCNIDQPMQRVVA